MIYFGKGCICWKSGKQNKVAQSTAEAEFVTITPGSNSVVWLRNVLKEMALGYSRASTVYNDNDVARATSNNPVHHSRMEQISLKYFVVRGLIKWGHCRRNNGYDPESCGYWDETSRSCRIRVEGGYLFFWTGLVVQTGLH